MVLYVPITVTSRPGCDTGSWLETKHHKNILSDVGGGKERRHRTGQQKNLVGEGKYAPVQLRAQR